MATQRVFCFSDDVWRFTALHLVTRYKYICQVLRTWKQASRIFTVSLSLDDVVEGPQGSTRIKPLLTILSYFHPLHILMSILMFFSQVYLFHRPPLWSSGQSSWLQIQRPGFDFQHYQKKSSGSGTGSTQPREYN
jgi:hypothetical protein